MHSARASRTIPGVILFWLVPNAPDLIILVTLALALYLGSCFAYGFGVQALDGDLTTLWAITMVVSLMHFWYDAFVWSVRRAQV